MATTYLNEQPAFLTNLCYTFGDWRRLTSGLVCEEGVAERGDLKISTGGIALDMQFAAGQAFVLGDVTVSQGTYMVQQPASGGLIDGIAADPTNPRIDTVVVTVRDSDYGGADNDSIIQVIPGTPTPGANLTNLSGAAAVPDTSLLLAYVLTPAAFAGPYVDATHILDRRSLFVACGRHSTRWTKLTRSTNQAYGDGSESVLTYPAGASGTALGDDWLTHSAGVVTAKRAMLLSVQASVAWAPHADALRRRTRIAINGVVDETNSVSGPALNSGGQRTAQKTSWTGVVAPGDTIEVQCVQNSGVSINVELASLVIYDLGALVA